MDVSGKALRLYPPRREAKPHVTALFPALRDGLVAGAVAGVLSGAPSTAHAVLTGRDPLAAARAAGNLLLPAGARPEALLAAGGLAHVVLSLGWGTVLAVAVRRLDLSPVVAGAVAGGAIAALDLGVLAHGPAGRRWPLIRALPAWPQLADHIAFGVVAGEVLRRRG
jgi:predicted acyltransferase